MNSEQDPPSRDDASTYGALKRLMFVGGVIALGALLTPLLPERVFAGSPMEFSLLELRLFQDPAGLPLVRLFNREEEQAVPAFAGGGGAYRAVPGQASGLSESVAQNLRGETRSRPARIEDPGQTFALEDGELEGLVLGLEGSEHLTPFFLALAETWAADSKRITRVAHYGDSSIATDLLTYTMRRNLQQRFGDSGHGFVLIAPGTMPYHHRDIRHRHAAGWDLKKVFNRNDSEGLYGYGGVAFRPRGGAFAEFGTDDRGPVGGRVSTFALFYRSFEGAGDLWFRIDRGTRQRFSTATVAARSGAPTDAVKRFVLPDGPHKLEIRPAGGGPTRLFGMVMEREGPGVVYDSLGLVGARARRLLHFNPEHYRKQLELRNPDLVVLGFGGNEADDPMERMPVYKDEFVRVIGLMRGEPARSCLILAPLDQARRDRYGRIATIPVVPMIVDAQRDAAKEAGCAFFNTYEAMGGEGSMRRWTRSRPRLAMTDYRHATPAGYQVIGNMLYKAMLSAFAEHMKQAAHP